MIPTESRASDELNAKLKGHFKLQSMLRLSRAGLPILSGFVVFEWNSDTYAFLRRYLSERNWCGFLLRHDKIGERPPYPMGGYVIAEADLEREVQWYLNNERVVCLLEPCSPLANGHCASILLTNRESLVVEIVGPGFDAGDLQRGQLSPHEIIEIAIPRDAPTEIKTSDLDTLTKRRSKVDVAGYERSVTLRLQKIYQRFVLGNLRFPGRISEPTEETIRSAEKYLIESGHHALLTHRHAYESLPRASLLELISNIRKLQRAYRGIVEVAHPSVLACSYVNDGEKLVFWDIVTPETKYVMAGS